MADIIDEKGNPIQLTDEFGGQVQLTDEHGVPVHLTGVATTIDSGQHAAESEPKMHGGTHFSPTSAEPIVGSGVESAVPAGGVAAGKQQVGRSESSSSSSSEDDGEGGRRKKKGLMQKIREKLPGGHKNKEEPQEIPAKVYTATTKVTVTTPGGPAEEPKTEHIRVEHHEEEHDKKKGFMDKIKEKLPGHHSH